MVQKKHIKNKGKNKPNKTTNFKKKKVYKANLTCFTCGELGHFSKDCSQWVDCRGKNSNDVNKVAASNAEAGYGNLPTILSVFQSPNWWIDMGANVYVCFDINIFTSY
jgi:hypothetical protein